MTAKDLKVGDYASDGETLRKVESVNVVPPSKIYEVITKEGYRLKTNAEHPYRTLVKNSCWWEHGKYYPAFYEEGPFVRAEDIRKGDLLQMQINPVLVNSKFKVINTKEFNQGEGRKIPDEIELNPSFGEVLGWLTGDGGLS